MKRALVALALVAIGGGLVGCGPQVDRTTPTVDRVLIVTLPGVTWDEVESARPPALRRFFAEAAIADASTRIGRQNATTTAAYLTIGAGTRAVVPGIDTGVALNPDEVHGGVPAREILERRLGTPTNGIAYIPVGATMEANQRSPFGAEPGRLGDQLAAAGIERAVIANADAAEGFPSDQPPPDGAFARSAATALMGSDGIVPAGDVGRDLLADDPDAPYGRRLDSDAVIASFEQVWEGDGPRVVLVEASDLARATAYGSRASAAQARRLRAEALQTSDELVARLLRRVDPARDAVLILAPTSPTTLGVVGLRAPGVEPGLLRSASTRRDGYVYLADVMPTVLELTGTEAPTDVEGRSFDTATATGDRTALLRHQAADAATRDERLPLVVAAVVVGLALLVAATARRDRLPPAVQRALRPVALGAIGLVPGTFVAGALPFTRSSLLGYAAVVLGVGALVAAVACAVDRRRPGAAPLVAVGSVVAVIVADVLVGAPLQVNSVFGYSMAVAGRFTGLGNLAFALYAVSVVVLAVLVHERWGARSFGWLGVGLVVAVVVDGLPLLGADVGGVVATVPAFALVLLVLRGRRIGMVEVLVAVALGLVVVTVFGLFDRAMPAGSQTHLARISEHVVAGRFDSVATVLWRRIHASFGGGGLALAVGALSLVAAAIVQAWLVATGRLAVLRQRVQLSPADLALAVGVGTLAVLGTVANDSSLAVPATMLIVVVPVLVLRRLPA